MRPKKIILCVAQNEAALGIRKFLLETRGYRVIGAVGAQQAIAAFNARRPDLVLTELILLPGLDGNELIRNLKAVAGYIPMILTARFPRPLATHHADAFLQDAIDTTELLDRIKILLIRKRGPRKHSAPVDATDQTARTA